MKTGNAATMKPGETRVRTRAGLEGVFISLLVGNRALIDIGGEKFTEFLHDIEVVETK